MKVDQPFPCRFAQCTCEVWIVGLRHQAYGMEWTTWWTDNSFGIDLIRYLSVFRFCYWIALHHCIHLHCIECVRKMRLIENIIDFKYRRDYSNKDIQVHIEIIVVISIILATMLFQRQFNSEPFAAPLNYTFSNS